MHRASTNVCFAALAVLGISVARLAAANVTLDYYSQLTTTDTGPPIPTEVISASIAGITSLSVQADGETVYAETIVITVDALVNGTSTLTSLISTPTTIVNTFAEDASRFSQSLATTVTLPGAGGVQVVDDEMVCTGAAGAQATCVNVAVQSGGPLVVSSTETFSAVRAPSFTITSGGARAASPAALTVIALAVCAVCVVL